MQAAEGRSSDQNHCHGFLGQSGTQLKYKTEGDVPDEIAAELKDCSDVIANTDQRMQKIYNTLKTNKTENKQE